MAYLLMLSVVQSQDGSWIMNWHICVGRSDYGYSTVPVFAWRGWEEPWNTWIRIADLQARIWKWNLL